MSVKAVPVGDEVDDNAAAELKAPESTVAVLMGGQNTSTTKQAVLSRPKQPKPDTPKTDDVRMRRPKVKPAPRVRIQAWIPEGHERMVLAEIMRRKEHGIRGQGRADKNSVVADAIEKAYGHLLRRRPTEADSVGEDKAALEGGA